MFRLRLLWDALRDLLRLPWVVADSVSWWLAWWLRYRALVRLAAALNRRADQIEAILERMYMVATEAEEMAGLLEAECIRPQRPPQTP
jgi:hypothetical protein